MTNTITVTGVGTARGVPNLARVNIGVEVLGRSVADVRAAAAADTEAVLNTLRSHGIVAGDMNTTGYSIRPEYDHREGRRLRGYRVTNTVEVRIRDLATVGEKIDAAAAAGSDNIVVHGLSFIHDDPTDLDRAARAAAWDDARRRARQLAELAGHRLSHAVTITEETYTTPLPVRAMVSEAAAATPFEPGEAAVTVTIRVEFATDV